MEHKEYCFWPTSTFWLVPKFYRPRLSKSFTFTPKFWIRPFFWPTHQNAMDPLHPHQPQHFFYQHHFFDPHQNFMDQTNQRHPHHNFIHTNHEPKLFSKLLLTQITGLRLHKTNNILLKSFVWQTTRKNLFSLRNLKAYGLLCYF